MVLQWGGELKHSFKQSLELTTSLFPKGSMRFRLENSTKKCSQRWLSGSPTQPFHTTEVRLTVVKVGILQTQPLETFTSGIFGAGWKDPGKNTIRWVADSSGV